MVGRSVAGAARAGSRGVGTSSPLGAVHACVHAFVHSFFVHAFVHCAFPLLSTLLSTVSSSTSSTALFFLILRQIHANIITAPHMGSELLIPGHGGYRRLKSFKLSQLIYDVTSRFCRRFIDTRSRTHDQMVQAARSGVQNIAEGSQASGTSKKTELKLTGVARASLEELRLDFEDFLRQRHLPVWDRSDPRRQRLIDRRCVTADDVALWVKAEMGEGAVTAAELAANGALALISVACALLDRQIGSLAKTFEHEGGFTERLYRVRSQRRRG